MGCVGDRCRHRCMQPDPTQPTQLSCLFLTLSDPRQCPGPKTLILWCPWARVRRARVCVGRVGCSQSINSQYGFDLSPLVFRGKSLSPLNATDLWHFIAFGKVRPSLGGRGNAASPGPLFHAHIHARRQPRPHIINARTGPGGAAASSLKRVMSD